MATSNLRFRIIGEDDASGTFLKVAATAKLLNSTFSDLGTNALGLTKLVGGAGLIPVLAGATAAAAELTTSLASGAGALGIFGLSVAGIGKDMVDAQTKITALDTKLGTLTAGTDDYRETLKELHDQQRDFNKQFGPAAKGLADLKTGFDKFKQTTSKVTTGVMGKAFELLASVLPRLAPVANAAGRAVGGLIDELQGWVNGPGFKAVLKWFKDSGPKAITHFGHIVGNTIDALGGILSNFVGPGDHAAKSLDRLTKRFADWGHSKGVSDSVNKFLKYVSSNGPQISSVFKSLAQIMPKLAIALGQLGALNLSAMGMFLNLVANMPQGAFNVIVTGMFGMLAAAKALAIVQGVSALLTGLAGSVALLGDACLLTRAQLVLLWTTEKIGAAVTGAMTAAQWLLNAAMTANPIGLVVVAIAALVAGLIIAYKKSETFRNIVNGAFHGVQVVASAVFGWIKGHWKLLASILGGPFVAAAIIIISHWGKIKAGASNAFGFIKSVWSKVRATLVVPFQAAAGVISEVWSKMRGFVTGYIKFIGGLPGKITAAIGSLSHLLYEAGRQVVQGLIDGIQSMVKPLTDKLHYVTDLIPIHKGPPGKDRLLLRPAGQSIMEGLVDGIERGYVPLKNVLGKVTAYIQAQSDKLKALVSARNQFAAGFSSFATSAFGADFGQDAAGNAIAPTASSVIAFQSQQAAQAKRLRANVRKLVHMGLSPALLKQLQAQGAAGVPTIEALAAGSKAQIRQYNALNKQTSAALHGAGMAAGNRIFGDQIVQTRNNVDLAKRIARELRRDNDHGKGEYVVVKVDGNEIIRAVRKTKRQKGQRSDV